MYSFELLQIYLFELAKSLSGVNPGYIMGKEGAIALHYPEEANCGLLLHLEEGGVFYQYYVYCDANAFFHANILIFAHFGESKLKKRG